MDIMSEFSERLSELMFDTSLTTTKLGEKIGVDNSAVSLWTTKKTVISLSRAIAVAKVFNCSLEYLFGRSDNLLDFTPHPELPFYERILELMKINKLSRYRVCIDMKKGHGHFDTWKNGADPRMNTVFDFAIYFDVTLDYLVGRER